ncbi:MAG TPA: phosphate ABC transporter substrate-binding protein [Roseiflexaceae bacterium]|nr:phosphate ABC transporter substrate-binding protein [Roseiflexaceae bacterium]
MRWRLLALLLCVALFLSACGGQEAGGLTVTGSTSVTPFAEHLAELYQHQHAGTTINIQGLGSSAGIRAALDGIAEIGMSSRELKAEEADQLDQVVIARDALAMIVNPSNPVSDLSREQIQAIFGGATRSWADLGGPDVPIVLVSREAGSGTYGAFEELVMKNEPIATSAMRQGSNGAIRQIVAEDIYAIGYISLGIVDNTVKALSIGGVQPSAEHVEDGSYTLVRPFLFVWRKGQPLGQLASGFLDYVLGPEGQRELTNAGLVRGEARQ